MIKLTTNIFYLDVTKTKKNIRFFSF